MADVEKILRLVADGILTPEEADEILAATSGGGRAAEPTVEPTAEPEATEGTGRQLRIEVSEGGRSVVNLRVPVNVYGLASAFLPGLSDEDGERIRAAIAAGARGPILDIGTDDGRRVLIVSE